MKDSTVNTDWDYRVCKMLLRIKPSPYQRSSLFTFRKTLSTFPVIQFPPQLVHLLKTYNLVFYKSIVQSVLVFFQYKSALNIEIY
jgi:hypothetical protein